jgi:gliding motility-associated-like protein
MKKPNRFLLFLLVIISTTSFTLRAQEQATQHARYAGKDFWFTGGYTSTRNDFFLSSKYNATVTFTYTTNNASYTTSVPANGIVKMSMPVLEFNQCIMYGFGTVMNKSLHIVSDSDVVIQYGGWGGFADDGSLIYPSDRQKYGDIYYTNGLPYLNQGGTVGDGVAGFSIVATCDNVTLEITPSRDVVGNPAGIPFTVSLNKGQTYAIGSLGSNTPRDISGTKIEVKSASCCNPINVFNIGTCAFSYWPYSSPNPSAACDYFFDQLLPVSSWDTSYYVLPYCNNPYTILKIVSSANNNILSLNGTTFATLNDGGTLDTIIRQPVHMSSSFPVSISQHMVAQEDAYTQPVIFPNAEPDDSLSDPNTAMVISMRDGIREAWFQTVHDFPASFGGNIYYNKLQVVAIVSKAGNVNTVMLNNNSIASQFFPFPGNPDYAYAYIRPDTGVLYHLTSADKIVANYYASARHGSMDFALGDVNPYLYYNELPVETIDICLNDSSTLKAIDAFSYEWSTGAATQEITTADTGRYYVLTLQDNDCIGDLQRFLVRHPVSSVQPINLGADTTICEGDQLVLKGQGPSTVWSTGVAGDSIVVNEPGVYWATAYDSCMLVLAADTIAVTFDACMWRYCNFHFPNAFSPNGDGLNDVLLPVYYGELNKYKLNIFNRLGQRVFSSSKPHEGWDGRIDGQTADVGVYFYHCSFYCPQRGAVQLKGDITLIR